MATVGQKGARAKKKPLWIFYDSEAANGNVYYGDIIEIAAKCHPGIVKGQFASLIKTNQELGSFGELRLRPCSRILYIKFQNA